MSEDLGHNEIGVAPKGTWAIIALTLSLCLVLGSFVIDSRRANSSLSKIDKDQTVALEAAGKAEGQLNSLARGVQALANGGNANAVAVVAVLQRNGVKINAK